jgi:hypothetical protein
MRLFFSTAYVVRTTNKSRIGLVSITLVVVDDLVTKLDQLVESLFKDVVLNHFCCQEEGNQSFKVTLLTHFLSDISLQQQTEY